MDIISKFAQHCLTHGMQFHQHSTGPKIPKFPPHPLPDHLLHWDQNPPPHRKTSDRGAAEPSSLHQKFKCRGLFVFVLKVKFRSHFSRKKVHLMGWEIR
jgi:hypothetical protein